MVIISPVQNGWDHNCYEIKWFGKSRYVKHAFSLNINVVPSQCVIIYTSYCCYPLAKSKICELKFIHPLFDENYSINCHL